jgi:hypothetical protein
MEGVEFNIILKEDSANGTPSDLRAATGPSSPWDVPGANVGSPTSRTYYGQPFDQSQINPQQHPQQQSLFPNQQPNIPGYYDQDATNAMIRSIEADKKKQQEEDEAHQKYIGGLREQTRWLAFMGDESRQFGSTIAKLASNDNTGVLKGMTEGMANFASMLGPEGQVVSVTLKTLNAAFESAERVVGSFVERGKQLSSYSPELALANATADVREIMADMREAQELGPSLARLTDETSKLNIQFREALLPIKRALIEGTAEVLTVVRRGPEQVIQRIDEAIGGDTPHWIKAGITAGMEMLPLVGDKWRAERLMREAGVQKLEEETVNILDDIIKDLRQGLGRGPHIADRDEINKARAARLNLPVFQGR